MNPVNIPVVGGLLFALGSVGCGSPREPAEPAVTSEKCDVTLTGPLIGCTYELAPQRPGSGGPIVDGDYDLVQILVHNRASGPSSDDNNLAFRMAMRFVTTERSSNHAEGRMTVIAGVAPGSRCESRPFATVQTQLRSIDAKGQWTVTPYSTMPGHVVLHDSEKVSYVFRRRS